MNALIFRNPNLGMINWEPIDKEENTNVKCLGIYSPTTLQMEKVTNPTNTFWKNLLPREYPTESTPLKDEL